MMAVVLRGSLTQYVCITTTNSSHVNAQGASRVDKRSALAQPRVDARLDGARDLLVAPPIPDTGFEGVTGLHPDFLYEQISQERRQLVPSAREPHSLARGLLHRGSPPSHEGWSC
jgi:hypothetical protein